MLRVVVLISGGGTNLQAIIDAVRDRRIQNTEIAEVISSGPEAYGLVRAAKAGVLAVTIAPKAFETRKAFEKALLDELNRVNPDLIVLAGYLVKIPMDVVREYERRIINIHPSLIPSFCGKGFYGLKVHEAALARGVKITGATVHYVDEELDAGPILKQKAVEVPEGITAEELQRKVMEEAEWVILPEAIAELARKENKE